MLFRSYILHYYFVPFLHHSISYAYARTFIPILRFPYIYAMYVLTIRGYMVWSLERGRDVTYGTRTLTSLAR